MKKILFTIKVNDEIKERISKLNADIKYIDKKDVTVDILKEADVSNSVLY